MVPAPSGQPAQPDQPQAAESAIERRIVTVLFADLVGFTSLSERLDPEDVASVQDAYFATVRDTITRYGGALELKGKGEAVRAWREGPGAWVIEDVHWAGGDLLAFLAHAGRAPSAAGRLIVATARRSLLERAPEWCAPAADAMVMDLLPPGSMRP